MELMNDIFDTFFRIGKPENLKEAKVVIGLNENNLRLQNIVSAYEIREYHKSNVDALREGMAYKREGKMFYKIPIAQMQLIGKGVAFNLKVNILNDKIGSLPHESLFNEVLNASGKAYNYAERFLFGGR